MRYGGFGFQAMGQGSRRIIGLIIGLVLLLGLSARPVAAGPTLGLVVDDSSGSGGNGMVTLFNADTNSVLGSVAIPTGGSNSRGDCVISADKKLAYVTNFLNQVYIIDLTKLPLTLLTPGVNPIAISNLGEDVTLSPRGDRLLTCDGSAVQPASNVLTQKRLEIQTLSLGSDCNSIDACQNHLSLNGTVLATTVDNGFKVRELKADPSGQLKDTGNSLTLTDQPNNVTCSPDGKSGIAITRFGHLITSFTIPGITQVGAPITLSGAGGGSTVLINPAGTKAYTRQVSGEIDVYGFTSSTGALVTAPLFTIPGAAMSNNIYFGMEQMALNPAGTKLYVTRAGGVDVYDANALGPILTTISNTSIVQPTGICIR